MVKDSSTSRTTGKRSNLYTKVLVLNRHYTPIKVITAKRAYNLLFKEYAEIIHTDDGGLQTHKFDSWLQYSQYMHEINPDGNLFVKSPKLWIMVPRIIRLFKYDRVPKFEISLTKKNLYIRDDGRCQYCGKKLTLSTLSIDHIRPKSRGGKSQWTNVVISCKVCNAKKSGRLPSEARMKLIKQPKVPTREEFLIKELKGERLKIWKYFLKSLT
jgi:5-methylcytosine-specific restriction endonuclease McrA